MIPIIKGNVENGKLKILDIDKYNGYLMTLSGPVDIRISKERKPRSLNQNNYYFGVLVKMISDHTGHSEYETHEILKVMFLPERIELQTKKGIEYKTIGKSTTTLSTGQMEEYNTKIREWASINLGLYIPLPNEVECY
jgi:hypothetical protein